MLGLPDDIKGCLFDLDGVLTRTAVVHAAAWKQVFDELLARRGDAPFTDEDYNAYVDGKKREDGVRDFLASRGVRLSEEEVKEIGDHKSTLVQERIAREGVEVYEGSRRYLQACRVAGLHRVVVSSSANTEAVLKVTGLDELLEGRIDGVIANEQHLLGKPAPDTFLAGARLLGLAPRDCAVFEDALAGVEAGRAGAFGHVVGVDRVGQGPDLRGRGADVVVLDLADLL